MAYFIKHSIKSIKLEDSSLVIEYQNSQTETKEANTSELKEIQSYFKIKGLTTLSLSDLEKTNTQHPTNSTPWIIGGGIIVVIIIGSIAYYFWGKNKKS